MENGWQLLILAQVGQGQVDSALASARLAAATGVERAAIGNILQVPVATAARRADQTKTRDAWLELVRVASSIDSIVPSPSSKYFVAVGAFYVGSDALQNINTSKNCNEVKLAEDMWTLASIDAPQGAQAGEDQKQVAAQIMSAIGQFTEVISQAKRAYCSKRR